MNIPQNVNGQATMANSQPVVLASNQSSIPIAGDVASGATDSGNPVKVGGVNRTTQPTLTDGQRGDTQLDTRGNLKVTLIGPNGVTTSSIGTPADNTSMANAFKTIAINGVYNGTNYDLMRGVANATNSTGTGIAAAGILAQYDDASPTTITENQFGNLRMSIDRSLYVENHYVYGRATADTQIKGSAGFVHTVSIAPSTATPTAGVLTIYDNTSETGTVIYSEYLAATVVGHTITLDVVAATGIYVGFDGSLNNVACTISYR